MPDESVTENVGDGNPRRLYANPPVVEAIALFQWSTPLDWTFTTPGVFFEALRDIYPEEPRAQAVVQAGLFAKEDSGSTGLASGANTSFEMRSGPQRILFSQSGGSRLLGVSPNDVSVHGLPPYEGWEALDERLRDGFDRLRPILGEDRRVPRSACATSIASRYPSRPWISPTT